MLAHLSIRNLAVAKELEIDLDAGMNAISGETGAGKSVLLDGLGMALGKRYSADIVRHGCKRADVSASFRLDNLPSAREWLQENELDEGDECILRRTIGSDGRSRAFINGHNVPLAQLRKAAEYLIDIHGQHAHQSLLRKGEALNLLDNYGDLKNQTTNIRSLYKSWQAVRQTLTDRQQASAALDAKKQLLTYQVEELSLLELEEGRVGELEQEQKQLEQAEDLLSTLNDLTQQLLEGDSGILGQLSQVQSLMNRCAVLGDRIDSSARLIEDARISLEEANSELSHLVDRIEINPERLELVEAELSRIYDLARKHQVQPDSLWQKYAELKGELDDINAPENSLESLEQEASALEAQLTGACKELSLQRSAIAQNLSEAITTKLQSLGLSGELVFVNRPCEQPGPKGLDDYEILVSLNKGQPMRALGKVASGGELSRISLCIQVVLADRSRTPTLVFDEVDVGIGGPTAEIVGKLMRQLGGQTQILCVTHLPQVASKAHAHLFVEKADAEGVTTSRVSRLNQDQRVRELARMLGGEDISTQGMALARELMSPPGLQ